jgi:hypothetical protein
MDTAHEIDGFASIKLAVSSAGKKGTLHLSGLYGSIHADSDSDFSQGTITLLSCPHCTEELPSVSGCPECGAKMAMMNAGKYATLHVCSRYGCHGHMLDITAPSKDTPKEVNG